MSPLITIEGIDGAGKTTLAQALVAELAGAVLLREPGGVALAEALRALAKDPALEIAPRAEALLFAAARAQLVAERLRPLLDAGTTVVLDRFTDSSMAYQGGGRELGIDAIGELNDFGTDGIVPDVTFLLALDPRTGAERAGIRGEGADRMEAAGLDFFTRVAAAYDELAARHPSRYVVLDATRSPADVLASALSRLAAG